MRTSFRFLYVLALLLIGIGCSQQSPLNPVAVNSVDSHALLDQNRDLERLAAARDGGVSQLASVASVVRVPAGSVDALQAAVDAAGDGGAVVLLAGAHTESNTTTISHAVTIVGERGAVLKVDTQVDPADFDIDPALHVLNTSNVVIWGLELGPVGAIGSTAILIERSSHVVVGNNRIHDYQNSVILQHGDAARIWGNHVVVTGAWQTGDLAEADGIMLVNGDNVSIAANDVSNGVFGVFASDRNGTLTGNNLHENFVGVIFCKIPAGGFRLPTSEPIGSEVSANHWTSKLNRTTGNLNAGQLVIDGANNNLLVSNASSSNGTYDIELVGESTRFGICTPTSFDNTVRAVGPFQHVVIKDCGQNNTVIGGTLVDTGEDPCDPPCPAPSTATIGRFAGRFRR